MRRSPSRCRRRRPTRALPRSARRSPPPPRPASMPSLKRWCSRKASSGTAISASGYDPRKPAVDNLAAAIELEQRDGMGWDSWRSLAEEKPVEPLELAPRRGLRAGAAGLRRVEFSRLLDATYTARHRLGLSARRRNAGAGRAPGRARRPSASLLCISSACSASKARTATTAPAPQPWAQVALPDGKTGLCRARQPLVADRRAALLRQGPGRRLADCRLHRRRQLRLDFAEKLFRTICESNRSGRTSDLIWRRFASLNSPKEMPRWAFVSLLPPRSPPHCSSPRPLRPALRKANCRVLASCRRPAAPAPSRSRRQQPQQQRPAAPAARPAAAAGGRAQALQGRGHHARRSR